MGQIDRATVESHLIDALQHLATAGVVIRHLDRRASMEAHDRSQLMGVALEVQAMLQRVTEDLDDRHPRRLRAQLGRDPEAAHAPADDDPASDDPAIRVIDLPDLVELVDRVTDAGDDGPSEPGAPDDRSD